MADQMTGLLSPWLRRRRIDAAKPYLKGRVLDYGCGTGALAAWCNADGYLGVDVDAQSLELARRTWPRHRFAAELSPDERFDVIVGLAMIEHIPQPWLLLRALSATLADGGRIILTTPHPAFRWIHELGARLSVFSREAADEHEELIGPSRMRRIARRADLSVVRLQRFLFGANQLFVLQKRAAGAVL